MIRSQPTLAEIRNAHPSSKKAFDSASVWLPVVRHISYYVAWMFIRLGISANQTTYAGVGLGIVGLFLVAMGGRWALLVGVLLINSWFLLDQVDGDIARYHRKPTAYGGFVDSLGAFLMYGGLFTSAGIAAYRAPDVIWSALTGWPGGSWVTSMVGEPWLLMVLGQVASLSVLLRYIVQLAHKVAILGWQEEKVTENRIHLKKGVRRAFFLLRHNLLRMSGAILPIFTIAAIVDTISIFVAFYALANLAELVVVIVNCARKMRARDERTTIDQHE